MAGKRRRPSASMIVACIALFVALGGGAYAAALARNSVTSKQVKNGSLKGKDLLPDTLSGIRVNESTLGQVPSALEADSATTAANANKLGGEAPSAYTGAANGGYQSAICNPTTSTFTNCASTTVSLPHAGKVLLIAGGGQNSYADVAEGTCEFRIDGALSATPSVRPGEPASDNTAETAQNGFFLTAVTASLAAGSHTFNLACNERVGDVEMKDTTISAVLAE